MITPLTIIEYTAMAVGVGAGVMLGIERLKTKSGGLKKNPTRCLEHRDRITVLERSEVETAASIARLEGSVGEVGKKVDVLLALHVKP